jgi:sugar phosphate isomerase/epimerase
MIIGTITCDYFMRIYQYRQPENFNWGDMCDKWRAEFTQADFLSLAEEIFGMGYEGLEIWEPTYSFNRYSTAEAEALGAKLRNMGCKKVAYCIGGWDASSTASIDKAYAFAKALGAETVTGCIVKADAPALLPVIEEAGKKYGLRYAIESHPAPNLAAPEDIALATAPYGTIGANLETGILHALGYDPAQAVQTLSGKIFHTHFKDTRRDEEGCFPLGEGTAPLTEVLKALRKEGFTGMVSVEFEYPTDPAPGLRKSIEFLRGHNR